MDLLEVVTRIISIITLFGSSIVFMLASVIEHTREIAVRKVLGAKNGTIAMQILLKLLSLNNLMRFCVYI